MAEKQPPASWKSGRLTDARGRAVTQLDPVIMHLAHQHGPIPPQPLRAIAQEVGIGMTRATRIAFWGGVVCLVCLVIALIILSIRLSRGSIGTGRFVRSLIPYVGIWVAPYAFWMGTRNARFHRTTRVMLAHRRCPHCGYDIRGLTADKADGATVCPECGCAWRLDEADGDAKEQHDG